MNYFKERRRMRGRYQLVHMPLPVRLQRSLLRDPADRGPHVPAELPLSAARLQARNLLPTPGSPGGLHLQMRPGIFG